MSRPPFYGMGKLLRSLPPKEALDREIPSLPISLFYVWKDYLSSLTPKLRKVSGKV